MPTAEAQLVLSCKATGTKEINKFNDAVVQLDKEAKKLLDTLGQIDRDGKIKNANAEEMRKLIDGTKQLSTSQASLLNTLKQEQFQTKATLNELLSAAAARKAYNAEMKLSEAQKNLDNALAKGARANRAEVERLRGSVEKLRLEYAKAAQAEANANLKAFESDKIAKGFNIVSKGAKETSGSIKNFSSEMLLAKIAGRAFNIELSGVSKELAQYAIIAKGAESAVKVFTGLMEHSNKALQERIYWMGQGISYDREKMESETALASKLKNTFDTLRELNEKENLSNSDRLKVQNIVDETRESFRQYGIQLDIVSGKVKNLKEAEIQFSEAAKKKEIDRLKSAIAGLKAQNNQLLYQSEGGDLAKQSRVKWEVLNFVLGDKLAIQADEAAKERLKNLDEIAKFQERIRELEAINPTKNINDREKARQADLLAKQKAEADKITKAFSDQIAAMREKVKFQNLINNGFSEEAKKLSAISELEKKFPKFSKDQINQLYNESKKLDDLIAKQNKITEAKRQAEKAAKEQQRNAEQLAKKAEQERSARAAITRELVEAGRQYKQMAGMAISANSAQGLLMQSRKMFNTGFQNLQNFQLQQNQKTNITQMITQKPGTTGKQSSLQNQVQRMNKIENMLEKIVSLIESGNGTRNEIKNSFSGTTMYN